MLKDLAKKKLLPTISLPKRSDLKDLFEYVGPLFLITIARLVGFISMQRRAMAFGCTQQLAAYQICANAMIFFLLFGEPLSQLHQTKLPAFLDAKDRDSTIATMKAVLTLTSFTTLGIGAATLLTLSFGSGIFTTDAAVQAIVKNTAPAVSFSVMQAIIATSLDGAMLASRDFTFIILVGLVTCITQVTMVARCATLSAIFGSFTLRLAAYSLFVVLRIASGRGGLGQLLARRKDEEKVLGSSTVPAGIE